MRKKSLPGERSAILRCHPARCQENYAQAPSFNSEGNTAYVTLPTGDVLEGYGATKNEARRLASGPWSYFWQFQYY